MLPSLLLCFFFFSFSKQDNRNLYNKTCTPKNNINFYILYVNSKGKNEKKHQNNNTSYRNSLIQQKIFIQRRRKKTRKIFYTEIEWTIAWKLYTKFERFIRIQICIKMELFSLSTILYVWKCDRFFIFAWVYNFNVFIEWYCYFVDVT